MLVRLGVQMLHLNEPLTTADLTIIGAGPAGLAAGVEALDRGIMPLVVDDGFVPGGQLIKQTHKFFGSRAQYCGFRGFHIAEQLHGKLLDAGCSVASGSTVIGLYRDDRFVVPPCSLSPPGTESEAGVMQQPAPPGFVLGAPPGTSPPCSNPYDSSGFSSLPLTLSTDYNHPTSSNTIPTPSHPFTLAIHKDNRLWKVASRAVLVATGASENPLAFPGCDLPGVYGAGAVQTLMNVHGVRPGRRVLMIGSGNIGLIVSYQLLQAGVEVVALVENSPRIGGYHVHAAKLRRCGVPVLTSHTVQRAIGSLGVEGAIVVGVDGAGRAIPGTEILLDVDVICLAVGLTPMCDLLWQAGCRIEFVRELGGHVAWHDSSMATSIPGLYVAGDVSGIEEASTAMLEGRVAAASIASYLVSACGGQETAGEEGGSGAVAEQHCAAGVRGHGAKLGVEVTKKAGDNDNPALALEWFRNGPFGAKALTGKRKLWCKGEQHVAGVPIDAPVETRTSSLDANSDAHSLQVSHYETDGVLDQKTLEQLGAGLGRGPGAQSSQGGLRKAVIECVQDIPCNPCVASCRLGAITIAGDGLNGRPELQRERCTGCGVCVGRCPGLAIFVEDWGDFGDGGKVGQISLPYEFVPVPVVGEQVDLFGRDGAFLGVGDVVRVRRMGDGVGSGAGVGVGTGCGRASGGARSDVVVASGSDKSIHASSGSSWPDDRSSVVTVRMERHLVSSVRHIRAGRERENENSGR